MKTKLLTLALFGILTFGFVSCADEEIAPANDTSIDGHRLPPDGGITERD